MKDPLLVFDLIQLLPLAWGDPDMLGYCSEMLILPAVPFRAPGAGAFSLEQGFLRFCACHEGYTPF
ncbi:hypothetical protein [Paenibacillus sp. S150]|uniref:hypothetical protein n=1 Tax=Paenibacillus sp. S150 TaxID=2749826 RepID=UPI001C569DD3|nr:hypothetical protein [Paenibacillus sp. S150]MBW4083334.1 hypothetical protein [Paenibacillus sp. S150]